MADEVCVQLQYSKPQSTKNECSEVKNKISGPSTNCQKTSNCELAISALLNSLPDLDNCFRIHEKIGEGTFSNVYLASLKGLNSNKLFAIKHLIPTSHPKRMKYELECLNRIGGKDNVVSCDVTMRQADCVVFVMPYLQHQKFSDYVLDMDVEETRLYMKNLLLALKRVHSFNIIHRDIKPSNFLYNRESKQFLLVDFGLAQKANEGEDNTLIKNLVPKPAITGKRKREDDDLENVDNTRIKRYALQTVSSNRQDLRTSGNKLANQDHHYRSYPQESLCKPLSNNMKRQPLTTSSSNVINNSSEKVFGQKPAFQNLMPQKLLSLDAQASFVRVQNSQVQTGPLFTKPTAPVRLKGKDRCECFGKTRVCNICLTRKAQFAPRAGTPGFRPPEVLLKYPHQTTAVDMWSAGVIMLCILSGCYPFFRSPDDITALCEIITVCGTSAIVTLAKKLGRNVICSESRKPLNLLLLCETLRRRKVNGSKYESGQPLCEECHHSSSSEYGCLCDDKCKLDLSHSYFPSSAFDLLSKLLDVDPATRISAEAALQHHFITDVS